MIEATLRNMRAHHRSGVIAFSPATREESSADPRDYFWLVGHDDEPLQDSEGNPMLLVEAGDVRRPL